MAKKNPFADLMHVHDYPRLQQLEAELKQYKERLPAAKERLEEATRVRDAAVAETERVERAILARRLSDSDLAVAQDAEIKAKQEYAVAYHEHQDIEKAVRLLPAEIEMAKQEGRAIVAANRRRDYEVALKDFRDKLAAAIDASKVVDGLAYDAHREFHAPDIHPRYRCSVVDAGDAGLLQPGAGIRNLSLDPLNRRDSVAEHLLIEMDAHLAELPLLAERDKARRPQFEHAKATAEREEERKLAMLAEAERANRAKYGL